MRLNPNRQGVVLRGLLAVCFIYRLMSVVYSVTNEYVFYALTSVVLPPLSILIAAVLRMLIGLKD